MPDKSSQNNEYHLANTEHSTLTLFISRMTIKISRFAVHGSRFSSVLIFLIVLTLTSCHSKKSTLTESATPGLKPWVMKYQRGPCFGQCPVYALYFLNDSTGLVYVHANLLEPGWYTAPLARSAVREILSLVEPNSWWHEDMSGQPQISDLPLLNLTYLHPDGTRTLTVQKQFSASLSNVFEKLNQLVTESKWVLTDMRPLESPEEPKTDVIIQLKEGVDIHDWMKKYEQFGIELKKKIAPRQQYYLVKKDPAKGDANDFLQYIKRDEDVIGAEWEKVLEQRKP